MKLLQKLLTFFKVTSKTLGGILMKAKMVKHQYLRSQWTPIITECKNSGMTVRAWCHKNDVNERQFYYWQRQIREELFPTIMDKNLVTVTPQFTAIPREIIQKTNEGSVFSPEVIITCGNIKIEVSNTTSPALLAELLKVINNA